MIGSASFTPHEYPLWFAVLAERGWFSVRGSLVHSGRYTSWGVWDVWTYEKRHVSSTSSLGPPSQRGFMGMPPASAGGTCGGRGRRWGGRVPGHRRIRRGTIN